MAFLTEAANRGSIATGYEIENSLKLEADNAEYLYYTPSGQTDYERMAFSLWIKRTELGTAMLAEFGNGVSNTSNLRIGFDSSDRLFCYGNSIIWRQTNQVFRDTSAWYHLFFLFDTTTPGGISNNRIRIWVNGEMIAHTDFGVINNPGSGAAMGFNNALQQSIGAQREDGPKNYFNGYMAQVYGSGGTPPVVTDFGEFDEDTGIWKPIDISELTPPDTAGFNLDFSDASNLGNDISTRNNNFTLQNITSADQATDTPTNNFCTLNPLYKCDDTIITDGATNCDRTTNGNNTVRGTFVVAKGKWYWEVAVYKGSINSNYPFMGMTGNLTADPCVWLIGDSKTFFVSGSGNVEDAGSYKGSGTAAATDPSYSIYGFAVDIDNRTLLWYTNGTANNSGNTYSMATSIGNSDEGMTPFLFMFTGANQSFNFGGYSVITPSSAESDANGYGTFEYAPPSGYYALCSKNLARFG
jgi:hypothetical protein